MDITLTIPDSYLGFAFGFIFGILALIVTGFIDWALHGTH